MTKSTEINSRRLDAPDKGVHRHTHLEQEGCGNNMHSRPRFPLARLCYSHHQVTYMAVMTAAAPRSMFAHAKILLIRHRIMKTIWAVRPLQAISLKSARRTLTTYRIEYEPLPVKYVLLGSCACKKYPVTQKIRSLGYSQRQTRRDRRCRTCSRRTRSQAMRLTSARTREVINVSWSTADTRGMERTDITADAVNPVRTVRFAVMNLLSA